MNFSLSSLQTISQAMVAIGSIFAALGTFGHFYFGKLIKGEMEYKYSIEEKANHVKELSDIVFLGRYHSAYESFLVMRTTGRAVDTRLEDILSKFKSLAFKFKLPSSIFELIDNISGSNNPQDIIEGSGIIGIMIYDFLNINASPNCAYLYLLVLSKETHEKLKRNKFPKQTLDIFASSTKKQAKYLKLPQTMIDNILSEGINYNNIIELILLKKPKGVASSNFC